MSRTLAQKRAEHALSRIRELQDIDVNEYGRYVSYVKAMPATIIISGLGQALAMEAAARQKLPGHKFLLDHLISWLGAGWGNSPYGSKITAANADGRFLALFTAITEGSEADYITVQAEVIEYLDWLKKFAVAFLVEPKETDAEEGAQ